MYGEQIFDVVPSLHQHAENAVGLAAFLGGHAFGHLFLHHAHHFYHLFFVFQHLEENLAADVVREIAYDGHVLLPVLAEVGTKEVALDEMVTEGGEVDLQVVDGLMVDFDDLEFVADVVHHVLGQHTRAGTHLDDAFHIGRQLLYDTLGNVLVGQEMLA